MGYEDPSQPPFKKQLSFVIFHKDAVWDEEDTSLSHLISGIENACRQNMYTLQIHHVSAKVPNTIQSLIRSTQYPMLLLASDMTYDDIRPFFQVQSPFLVLDACFLSIRVPIFRADAVKSAFMAGRHFLSKGHKNIGLVTTPLPRNLTTNSRCGMENVLQKCGLTLPEENIFQLDHTPEGALEDMRRLLSQRTSPLPTALYIDSSGAVASVLQALNEHGLQVPRDISVIASDTAPFTREGWPRLTTVEISRYAMGYQAVEHLLMQLTASSAIFNTAMDVNLAEGGSVLELTAQP